jgi:hypothetical protein
LFSPSPCGGKVGKTFNPSLARPARPAPSPVFCQLLAGEKGGSRWELPAGHSRETAGGTEPSYMGHISEDGEDSKYVSFFFFFFSSVCAKINLGGRAEVGSHG